MSRRTLTALLGTLIVAGTACQPPPDSAAGTGDTAVASATHDDHAVGEQEAGGHAHAAPGEGGLPLLAIMQGLGSDMTALTYSLVTDDHEGVARRAASIAEHAPISAEDLERIHGTLGEDMARFEAVDESVHVASRRLHEAARADDPQLVITRLGEVQRGCVSCHTQFRERLRTNTAGQ